MRIRINWQWKEDRFIEELDKRLKYNWRDKCGVDEEFYKDLESHLLRQSLKEKKRCRTLIYKV